MTELDALVDDQELEVLLRTASALAGGAPIALADAEGRLVAGAAVRGDPSSGLSLPVRLDGRTIGQVLYDTAVPEDLAALTMEASAMAMVPLAGTQHTVGRPDMTRY